VTASFDVVVVGAGVIGASVAMHLARERLRVAVLDSAAAPGAGSTARATGGFRAQFGTAINVRLSLLSRAKLRAFREETGIDPCFAEVGYLWLASNEHELAVLREANALQQREGLTDACIASRNEIAAINPRISLDGVVGGAWGPSGGVMQPLEILRGYLEAGARCGVELRWNEAPIAFERSADGDGERITAVVTSKERYATGLVVNAAGAWAANVARLAGIAIPVTPLRRQVALTAPTTSLPPDFPMTIWTGDGFHLRVRDGRVLLLRPTPATDADGRDPFGTDVDPEWLADTDAVARARVPSLAGTPLDRVRSWAGLYEMSPDHHVLLGPAPGCPNLLLANGSSGHGVMHAPALGQLIAEIAVHGHARAIDVHELRPSRFLEGAPIAGAMLL
jgi:sarcosine oxidase, subunit beta